MVEGSTGFGVTHHIFHVFTGEDVSSKIKSVVQNAPRAVCILSATGALSTVTLFSSMSGGTTTYQGWFEIRCLSGLFEPCEIGGELRTAGGLSVIFSGSDGRLVGGRVAGCLIAASPVQVVLSVADGPKEPKSANHFEASPAPLNANLGGMTAANSLPSSGTSGESSSGTSGESSSVTYRASSSDTYSESSSVTDSESSV
ncbi:hypothetical protein K7X08_013856 [Anisodus acutangulus]|uniref:AT-hook motif nuclear-localized protein n=1 Tax=Anisodus acutangulus TaxID=402998 RepID=A0A9Q1R494_9SOLA|nr:hypothetical protein K7X08_013856 [Anisodus acutangulus]